MESMRARAERLWCSRIAVFSLCLLVTFGCTRDEGAKATIAEGRDTMIAATGAILPVSQGPALIKPCTRLAPQGVQSFYLPAAADIAELEERMPEALAFVRSRNSRGRNIVPPFATYYRQYGGLVKGENRRTIYISAFPRESLMHLNELLTRVPKRNASDEDTVVWRRDPIAACDGGAAFWSMEYDPETREFSGFEASENVQ